MRRIFVFCLLLIPIALTAQNWNLIRQSKEYVWGEGTGSTINEADQNALVDLASRISVVVQSEFNERVQEIISQGKNINSETFISSCINTYSNITLNNTHRMVLQEDPETRVGRWLLRSEVDTLFHLRLIKAQHIIDDAIKAENCGKVSEALRHYYRAYLLALSLPSPAKALYKGEDGQEHLIGTWVPQQMRAIMDAVDCQMVSRDGDDIEVQFTYNGKPAEGVDFTYHNGRDWQPSYSSTSSNGKGTMEMISGFMGTTLQTRLEYEYRTEVTDQEIKLVMQAVPSLAFPKAKKSFKVSKVGKATPWDGKSAPISTLLTGGRGTSAEDEATLKKTPTAIADDRAYVATMKKVLTAIRNKQYNGADDCLTPEGRDIFQRLLQYGQAKIVGTPQPVFHQSADGVVCRGVQMSFSFKNGVRKSFVEDIVFTFDKNALIKNISFGLGQAAQQDILCKGIWDERVRVAIMQFLENYKTAYALERIDYLRDIFDDNAVIIVGSVVKNTGQRGMNFDENSKRITRDNIRYSHYNKDQYLKKLKECFDSNEFVNIRFANNDVVKQGKGGELYSIQIEQDYYSSNYGDHGYLMLMVDMNDADQPLIKVRTWQPERDPKFGLYGPGDFK